MSGYSCPECEDFDTDSEEAMTRHLYHECPVSMSYDEGDHRYNPAPHCGKCGGPCTAENDEGVTTRETTPDDVLSALDSAQAIINGASKGHYNLRALLWHALDDVLLCARQAAEQQDYDIDRQHGADAVVDSIADFLTNHYGDD